MPHRSEQSDASTVATRAATAPSETSSVVSASSSSSSPSSSPTNEDRTTSPAMTMQRSSASSQSPSDFPPSATTDALMSLANVAGAPKLLGGRDPSPSPANIRNKGGKSSGSSSNGSLEEQSKTTPLPKQPHELSGGSNPVQPTQKGSTKATLMITPSPQTVNTAPSSLRSLPTARQLNLGTTASASSSAASTKGVPHLSIYGSSKLSTSPIRIKHHSDKKENEKPDSDENSGIHKSATQATDEYVPPGVRRMTQPTHLHYAPWAGLPVDARAPQPPTAAYYGRTSSPYVSLGEKRASSSSTGAGISFKKARTVVSGRGGVSASSSPIQAELMDTDEKASMIHGSLSTAANADASVSAAYSTHHPYLAIHPHHAPPPSQQFYAHHPHGAHPHAPPPQYYMYSYPYAYPQQGAYAPPTHIIPAHHHQPPYHIASLEQQTVSVETLISDKTSNVVDADDASETAKASAVLQKFASVSEWQRLTNAGGGKAPSTNRCMPLKEPIPSKYWGEADKATDAMLPDFHNLVNFPDYLAKPRNASRPGGLSSQQHQHQQVEASDGKKHCVMCGKLRVCSAASLIQKNSAKPTSKSTDDNDDDSSSHIIPRQNKGLCTACDVTVWVITDSGLEIKWCKGCKNLRPWAAFGDKGSATKCVRCRQRQREKYAMQKGSNVRAKKQQHSCSDSPSKAKKGKASARSPNRSSTDAHLAAITGLQNLKKATATN